MTRDPNTPRQRFLSTSMLKSALISTLVMVLDSSCSVLSIADAAVSGTVSVVSTGVSAASSVVKAVLPSGKEAAK